MYGQITTGKPIRVTSRVGKKKAAHVFDIQLDTRKNEPVVTHDEELADWHQDHGTRVELEIVANWQQGQRFVNRYVEHTALANPHATIHYTRPVGASQRQGTDKPGNETLSFPRATTELPKEALEIKPHPHGVELGALMLLARESKSHDVRGFLQSAFSRVSAQAAGEILSKVAWGKKTVRPARPGEDRVKAEELHKAIGETKLMSPPTNCLSPIGDELMRKGLVSFLNVIESEGESEDENAQLDLDSAGMKQAKKAAKAEAGRARRRLAAAPPAPQAVPDAPAEEGVEKIKGHNYFISTVTRPPRSTAATRSRWRWAWPTAGAGPPTRPSSCSASPTGCRCCSSAGPAASPTRWCAPTGATTSSASPRLAARGAHGPARPHRVGMGPLHQRVQGGRGPLPGDHQGDPAGAQECGRKLAAFIRKRKAEDYQAQRRSIFELYIEEVAAAIGKITGRKPDPIKRQFLQVAHKVTAAEMKEEQKAMGGEARPAKKTRARSEDEEE
jgi:DNA topoisomerase-6 subunit B